MRIGAILQARMTSVRLPGKILRAVAGRPMLAYTLETLEKSHELDDIVLATSNQASDDPVAEFCESTGRKCFRGDLDNVASRFLGAAEACGLDAFVRINGDSPMMDHRMVDRAVGIFRSGEFDVVTNILERTFPKGMSVEVVRVATFRTAYARMSAPEEFEHVTPHFYRNAGEYIIHNIKREPSVGTIQLSVDDETDMALFEKIVSMMSRPHWEYTMDDILEFREKALRDARGGKDI